jgi:transposase
LKHKEEDITRLQRENKTLLSVVSQLEQTIAGLRRQLTEAIDGNKELRQQISDLQDKLDRILFQLEKKNKKDFGRKTERHNPRQAENNGDGSSPKQPDKQENKGKNRNHKKNIKFQNLPVHPQHHKVSEAANICPECKIGTVFVGNKVTSQLEKLKHSLVRLEHLQETRSCPKCKQYVVTADKTQPPFPGALCAAHLLANVVVGKLADGLPNYRQNKIFMREQAIIPRSTQSDWIISGSLTLQPLYDLLKSEVLKSKVIQTDDTWAKVQDRSLESNLRKGKMTPYLGDKQHPYTVFDYSPNQTFARNIAFFSNFTGFVQADASNGFDALFKDGSKIEIGCNAHARRQADEAKSVEEEHCNQILDIYTEMYKIEEYIADKTPEIRLAYRQMKSKPLTIKLRAKLLFLQNELNPSNPLRDYVDYTLRHWIALTRYLDDPDFEIDNNAAERAIKIFVLVRKNSLFLGSDRGGRAAAIHLSIIASCERNSIDPVAYLTDVFERINSMKTSELDQLLPDRWIPPKKTGPPKEGLA